MATNDLPEHPKIKLAAGEGSFVRWQAITIAQLGYAVHLLLGFATATLGFCLVLLRDTSFVPTCLSTSLFLLSLLLLIFSIVVGFLCVVNRLWDFRKTAKIARDREAWNREGVGEDEIGRRLEKRRKKTKKLGERTWMLFYWQAALFVVGVLCVTVTFVMVYRSKLL